MKHVRLGRRISAHVRHRLEAGDRRDVDHRSVSAFEHGGHEPIGELGDHADVEANHSHRAVDFGRVDFADQAEAGVVHQQFDGDIFGMDTVDEVFDGIRRRQVAGVNLAAGAVFGVEVAGKLFQQFAAAQRERGAFPVRPAVWRTRHQFPRRPP